MKIITIFVALLVVASCMAADQASSKKSENKGEPKAPSGLPKPAGTKQNGKDADLKSAETFGFGFYGGLRPNAYYPPVGLYPSYYGYPYNKVFRYGYPAYPYAGYGYRGYSPYYGHHYPYWG